MVSPRVRRGLRLDADALRRVPPASTRFARCVSSRNPKAGRHRGLKIPRANAHPSSSLGSGTNLRSLALRASFG